MWPTTAGGERPAPAGHGVIAALGGRLRHGRLEVRLPHGRTLTFAGRAPGPHGTLIVHRARVARRFATGGAIGFAEAYVDGDVDSPDLADFLTMFALNLDAFGALKEGRWWLRLAARALHGMNRNTRRGSRRNIARHYDLGNRFYEQWLDRTMTYSAADFARPDASLEDAQRAKYERLARMLDVPPGGRVLEIGCGWGGFAEHLATTRDCRLVCVTISREQHDYAAERIRRLGLAERVEIRLQDYRDVTGQFDRVASIEMLEAVGRAYWPVFFDRLRERLKPGGRAALQVITIADRHAERYYARPDFIQRHVFPGGVLPSPAALARHAADAGLVERGRHVFGACYAATLRAWADRFQAAWPAIAAMPGFDERFRRLWSFYLAYCEAGFRAGRIDVRQFVLDRP